MIKFSESPEKVFRKTSESPQKALRKFIEILKKSEVDLLKLSLRTLALEGYRRQPTLELISTPLTPFNMYR